MRNNLDDTDLRILGELQRDGRQTHQELSEKVHLSPSPCARRIKRLEASGYITGYRAEIDETKVGYGFSLFVSVKLDRQVEDQLEGFEREVRVFPEVVDCWLMTGSFDYLLRIAVEDLAEFERFLTSRLTKLTSVASIESSIPIRRVKGGGSRLS